MYRQGDVLIKKAKEILDLSLLEKVEKDNDRIVLAYGEATGHAHAIKDNDSFLYSHKDKKESNLYLVVNNDVQLVHEEHSPIKIEKGKYVVRRQVQYTPEEIKVVAD